MFPTMSVVISFLAEKQVFNLLKAVLPKFRQDILIEDRSTPPLHTIRVVVHDDCSWHFGATAPHVTETSVKQASHTSKFLGP